VVRNIHIVLVSGMRIDGFPTRDHDAVLFRVENRKTNMPSSISTGNATTGVGVL
jgi:hypothetical protein